MNQEYFFKSKKTFDEKAGIFVHHHGAGTHPTVNINNYKEYITNELNLVQQIGYKHIAVPFTHVISEDSEFVLTLQYLVGEALSRDLTVMVIAQGIQSKLIEEEIEVNATAYLNNFVKFVKKNTGRGIIYEGINEPNSSNWYGQNNMGGYRKAMLWNNRLKRAIKSFDETATFVEAVLDPNFGIPLIQEGLVDKRAYALHPYINGIGNKGGNTPERKLLNPTYSMSYDGSKFAATEFGIAVEGSGIDPEANWQGLVTPEEGAALTVRQMIIHDALGIPMQYNFILGYLYVFHQYQYFDLNQKIQPVGAAVQNALQTLKGFYFNRWIWTDVGKHKTYIAEYIKDGKARCVYWNADSTTSSVNIAGKDYEVTSAPQYTDDDLSSIKTYVVQTPVGLKSIDVSGIKVNKPMPLQLPEVTGYQHNEVNFKVDEAGNIDLSEDIIYKSAKPKGLSVKARNLTGDFVPKLKSPDGSIWWQSIDNAGKVNWTKNKGTIL